MAEPARDSRPEQRLTAVTDALDTGAMQQVRRIIAAMNPAEIAHLLESLPVQSRNFIWGLVDSDDHGAVLLQVGEEVRDSLIRDMDRDALLAATEGLDVDDLADLLHELPETVMREVLASMDRQDRQRVEAVLSYDEDTAGGLMNTDTVTVRADVTLDVVLRYLRMRGQIPEPTDRLFVVNRFDTYLGVLPLTTVLTRDTESLVAKVMDTTVEGIPADLPATEVAKLFEDRDLVSAPVVDGDGRLIGRITIDDVVDVIREEGEHELFNMAGLPEEADLFAPIVPAARRRGIWLGVNLVTAFIASWVISLFEGTLQQIVALAVLMPIVASMGGIAGGQTLTLVIRGLALGQIGRGNSATLMWKEIAVGALNGVIWATVVAVMAGWWFGNAQIGWVIAAAMIVNLLCASLAGVGIPLLLRTFGVDPAIAGGVILTTVTDVVGFFAFLGLASLYLV